MAIKLRATGWHAFCVATALASGCSRAPENDAPAVDSASATPSESPQSTSSRTNDVEWPVYGGSLAAQHYSPLDQINASNVKDLKIAWRWHGGNFGPTPEMKSETTPLMIGGVLYATAGATRNVVAIDAGSGETLWIWRPNDGERVPHGAAPHVGPRRRVLDGAATTAACSRDAGLLSRVARRGDGLAEARVRRGRHRGSAARLARADGQRRSRLLVAAARRRRRHRRRSRAAASARGRMRRRK